MMKGQTMPKFNFHMGVTLRCYGDVEIEAESIEAALPMLTADYLADNIDITETTTDSGQDLAVIDVSDPVTGETLADYGGHALPSPYDPKPDVATISDLLTVARAALAFIEEEAENRSEAGSTYSDYEKEPRDLAESLASAIAKAEGRANV
jgi:hypothetical protein